MRCRWLHPYHVPPGTSKHPRAREKVPSVTISSSLRSTEDATASAAAGNRDQESPFDAVRLLHELMICGGMRKERALAAVYPSF